MSSILAIVESDFTIVYYKLTGRIYAALISGQSLEVTISKTVKKENYDMILSVNQCIHRTIASFAHVENSREKGIDAASYRETCSVQSNMFLAVFTKNYLTSSLYRKFCSFQESFTKS